MDPVVRIGGATYDRITVTEIVVPEGVTRIDDGTFFSCYNLVSISLPASLEQIGRYAFYSCSSLEVINIPPSAQLTHIHDGAFDWCGSLIVRPTLKDTFA